MNKVYSLSSYSMNETIESVSCYKFFSSFQKAFDYLSDSGFELVKDYDFDFTLTTWMLHHDELNEYVFITEHNVE